MSSSHPIQISESSSSPTSSSLRKKEEPIEVDDEVEVVKVVKSSSSSSTNTSKQQQQAQRRSGRERESTVIYVDGQAVKKQNNYVLKGDSYQYGGAKADAHAPAQQRQQKAALKKALLLSTSTLSSTTATPKKPRVITATEKQRLELKKTIQGRIQAKQSNRQQFLKANVEVLTPFLDPKVVRRIQSYSSIVTPATATAIATTTQQQAQKPIFLQPDAIQGDMRDYQLEGLNWMASMYSKNLGFILGDEMGL
jgi:SNF2 family DNA or RNA helicase